MMASLVRLLDFEATVGLRATLHNVGEGPVQRPTVRV